MDKIKATMIVAVSALICWLGILAVPALLMVGCNIIDYIIGIWAAGYRTENVNSYKGIRGIMKKICMWLLALIGAWIDILIDYAMECAGVGIELLFVVATVVAVWLVVNEIISILENMLDIGVHIPPFLLPVVKYIKKQAEDKAKINGEEGETDNED